MLTSTTGTVRLVGAVFFARHGVMPEEHRVGGRFEVDVAMDLDFTAAVHNDLAQTVNYERVYALIHEVVMGQSSYLIERLAYLIAEAIGVQFAQVRAVEVTVKKANPPVGGTCERAEAVYRAVRA